MSMEQKLEIFWLLYLFNLIRVEPGETSSIQADLFLEDSAEESKVNLSILLFFEQLLHVAFNPSVFASRPEIHSPSDNTTTFYMPVRSSRYASDSTAVHLQHAQNEGWKIKPFTDGVATFQKHDGSQVTPDILIMAMPDVPGPVDKA